MASYDKKILEELKGLLEGGMPNTYKALDGIRRYIWKEFDQDIHEDALLAALIMFTSTVDGENLLKTAALAIQKADVHVHRIKGLE